MKNFKIKTSVVSPEARASKTGIEFNIRGKLSVIHDVSGCLSVCKVRSR